MKRIVRKQLILPDFEKHPLSAGICNIVVENIDILYIFIFGIAAHSLAMEEIVKAFMALPALLIVSYRFCKSLLIMSTSFLRNSLDFQVSFDPISRFILLWSFGTVLVVLLAMFLNFLGVFSMQYLVTTVFAVIVLGIVLDKISNKKIFTKHRAFKISLKNCFVLLVPVTVSVLLIGYIMIWYTEFPSPMGGIDTFAHLSYISQITEDNYLNPVPNWIAQYPPTLNILFATACSLFDVSPLSLFWTTPFLFYPLFSIGVYLLSYQLTERRELSLLAAIIGVFATGYPEKVFVGNLYYIIPKNIIYLLFPFFLFLIEKNITRARALPVKHSSIPRESTKPLRNPAIHISKNPNVSTCSSFHVRTGVRHSGMLIARKGKLKKDLINLTLAMANSLLIYSVLSLSLSQAIHRLPIVYVVGLVMFCLFVAVKKIPTYFLLLGHLIFLFSMIGMFFALSPEEMFPYQGIYLGIFIVILNIFIVTLLRRYVIPKDFLLFSVIAFISFFVHMPMGLLLICVIFLYSFGKLCVKNSFGLVLVPLIIVAPLLVFLQLETGVSPNWIDDIVSTILVRDYSSGVLYDLSSAYRVLETSFSSTILLLVLVGSFAIVVFDKPKYLYILSTFCVLGFLYFLPIPGSYRSFTYMTPFVSFFSAYALVAPSWVFRKMGGKFTRINGGLHGNSLKRVAVLGYVSFLAVILLPNIIQPHSSSLQYIMSWSEYQWSPSILGYNDIQASAWVKRNTPKDAILISEPNTRVIFSSLANREESFNLMGVNSKIREIFETTNATQAYDLILELRESVLRKDQALSVSGARFLEGCRPVIIIVNGRTSKMVLTPNVTYGPAHPFLFEPFEGFGKFNDTDYYIPLYEVHEEYEHIYIFGVKMNGTAFSS